jgi:DNA-binding NarL/FixJ family response regulator
MLTHDMSMEVVGEAVDGQQAVTLARELQPDLIIMDINMPGMNGIEATRTITHDMPDIKILVLSMHSDKRYVMEMLSLGVSAYLLKDCAQRELNVALDKVMHNKMYISPDIGAEVIKDCLEQMGMKESVSYSPLSPRERQVLKLLADGRHNKEIADYLNMSIKTVEGHRQNIMQKLNLHTVAELTKYAIREGITGTEK